MNDFSRDVRKYLVKIERNLVSARAGYGRQAARLLREASVELGRLETKGEREWRRLNVQARRGALHLLKRLEKMVGPEARSRRPAGATRAARKATRGAQRVLRTAASRVAPRRKKARRR